MTSNQNVFIARQKIGNYCLINERVGQLHHYFHALSFMESRSARRCISNN